MKITPMLGANLVDLPEKVLEGKNWRMSEKVDGVRRLFYKDEQCRVSAFSRTNHDDPWLTHIFEFLESERFPCGYVYDCELVDRHLYFKDGVPSFVLRSETNSKASQQYADNKQDLIAVCFDMFKPNGDLTKAKDRDELLYTTFQNGNQDDPMIRVPIFGVLDGDHPEPLSKIMAGVEAKDGEGIMLLDMDSIYIPGRSKALIKVKRMKEFVGRIIDVEMARPGTKIEGMVAAVICEVPGCTIPVRVGSGFNNSERMEMATNSPIGRIIEIDAFSYSRNKAGTISLNLPVFKQFKRR